MIVEIRDEVIALSGKLERNHWRTLESAVNVRLRHHPAGIVVDCGGLSTLSREGAQTFREAADHIAHSGARIVVANVPGAIMRVLRQIPNLGSQLPLAASVADARASLGLPASHQPAPGETRRSGSAAMFSTPDIAAVESADDGSDGDQVGRAVPSAAPTVVAGLLGTEADDHAVAVACRLVAAATGNASVHLAYVLVVPRHVPLLSALGPEEEQARAVLERLSAGARGIRGITAVVPRLERTRDPATRLTEVARMARATCLVIALPADPPDDLQDVASALLIRATCQVIIDRLQPPQRAAMVASVRNKEAR